MITLKNVTKKYGEKTVLSDISFTFPNKGLICIYGASGSGKTTLLQLLAGFDTEYKGEIEYCQKMLNDMDEAALCNYRSDCIGFVFQNYHLLKGYTVQENVLLGCEQIAASEEEKIKKAQELLKRVGLEHKFGAYPEKLSGGQKQRAAIARALVSEPKLILADEPTGSLDKATAEEIIKLLKEIAEERLVILITHDKRIKDSADYILNINGQKLEGDAELVSEQENKLQEEKKEKAKVSVLHHTLKNFSIRAKLYVIIAFILAAGFGAFALSIFSGNMMKQAEKDFQEKNTAILNGQVKGGELTEAILLLKNNEHVVRAYNQFNIRDITLQVEDKIEQIAEKIPMPKATETLSYGIMPRDGKKEIAMTPSLAKKFGENMKELIGKTVSFSYGSIKEELTISGIYNAGYDDFFISPDLEQRLYEEDVTDKSDIHAVAYDTGSFQGLIEVKQLLNENGFTAADASGQAEAFIGTFKQIRMLFRVLSFIILGGALAISIILLFKMQQERIREAGLLSALGFRKKQIVQMFFSEMALLALIAVPMNGILLLFAKAGLQNLGVSYPITIIQFVFSMAGTFLLLLAVGIFAVRKPVRMEPAKALHS